MNGDRLEYSQAKIRNILKKEFLISEDMLKQRSIEEAAEALETYESIEEFLDKTGWRRDNPECSSEEYLTGNRICRWVDGTLIYFSRLIWEEMETSKIGEIHVGNGERKLRLEC